MAEGSHPQAAPSAEMVVTEGSAPPSKNALKKAQKEKEKAEKAAKRAEEERKQKEAAAANDTAKGLYGQFEGRPIPKEQKGEVYVLPALKKGGEETWIGKQVVVVAWVHNARIQSAKLGFFTLREGIESIQAVIAEGVEQEGGGAAVSRQMVKWCGDLSKESIVHVTALVQKPFEPVKSATISNLELHVQKCFVIAQGPPQLAMQIKDAMNPPPVGENPEVETDEQGTPIVALNTRLNNRVLDLRTHLNFAIFEINGQIKRLFHEFMWANGFKEFETPKMLGAATEGGSNVFQLKYFDTTAYLGQSPQFYKQMLIAAGRKRVYEIGPVFRAENSNTPRHLTEFTGLDFEMCIDNENWEEVPDMVEKMIYYIFSRIPERCKREMEEMKLAYPEAGNFKLPEEGRAPRIKFSEGVKLLKEAGYEASENEDISTTNEKALGRLIREKYNSDFYIMTHYPTAARPFYTHLTPGSPQVTNSYDAFMRGQEIVSGAQRIHNPEDLAKRMRGMEPPLDPESEGFRDYVEAFKNGCPPHGGAGFGLNRLTMLYLGLPNIRQATLFPRDPSRLAP